MGQLDLRERGKAQREGWRKKEGQKKEEEKRAIGAFLDALAFDRNPAFRLANRDVFYLEVGERSAVRSLPI